MNIIKSITLGLFFLSTFISPTFSNIELQSKSLLYNRVELKIPTAFEIINEEMLKLKYPLETRPTLVYTNESGSINVALIVTKHKASQDSMLSYKDNFVSTFTKIYPTAKWKASGITVINGRKVGFLELITPAIDIKIYNLMFFTDLDGQLLLCTFNCTEKSIKDWEPTAKEIMQSLKTK